MNFPAPLDGPESVATLGWLVGALAGAAFDIGLLFAIFGTPRLREHGAVHPPPPRSTIPLRMPAIVMVVLWLAGWFLGGASAPLCYVVHSALAAATLAAAVMLVLMATAAHHVARRSIW
jgi:hypothetical protein